MSCRSLAVAMALCVVACESPPLATSPLSVCTFPPEHGVAALDGGRADIRIVYDADDAAGLRLAIDMSDALREMTGAPFPFAATRATGGPEGLLCQTAGCPRHVIAVGAVAAAADGRAPHAGTVRTRRVTVGNRSVWLVTGAGPRDAAFAAYRFLDGLGVRYLHPRGRYVPHRPELALDLSLEQTDAPGFDERVWRFDTRRATPASWALGVSSEASFGEAARIVDWLVANGQSSIEWTVLKGFPADHTRRVVAYAHERGLRAGAAVALYRGAEGQLALIEPNEAPEEAAARVAALASLGFDDLAVGYDERTMWRPSPERLRDGLEAVSRAAVPLAPALRVRFTATPGAPPPPPGASADAQPFAYAHVFADDADTQIAALAAAPRDAGFVAALALGRGVDLDLPVFMPAYWYVHWADANRLLSAPELSRQVTVDPGWEWGYWAHAAVAFAVAWGRARGFHDTLSHVFAPLGRNTCDRLVDTLAAAAAAQYEAIDGGLAGDMTGPHGDAGWAPWPPPRNFVSPLTDAAALHEHTIDPLRAFADRWTILERALVPTLPRVDDAARPFVQELIDGFVITRLKMRHRLALLDGFEAVETGRTGDAAAALEAAHETRNLAALIVAARESQYRYAPGFLAGVASNQTTFPYGYLNTTRTLDSWGKDEAALARLLYPAAPAR